MTFDLEEKLYVFEVTLGFRSNGEEVISMPFLVLADDPEEAEELALVHLNSLDAGDRFWVAELSEPVDAGEFDKAVAEGERDPWRHLEEMENCDLVELLMERSLNY